MKCLWIGSKASCGKSFFIRRIRVIFAGDEVAWRGEYLPVRSTNRPDLKCQLVTCEEFNFHTAFNATTIETTKLMFEGQPSMLRGGPYKQFDPKYANAVYVIASNTMPREEA